MYMAKGADGMSRIKLTTWRKAHIETSIRSRRGWTRFQYNSINICNSCWQGLQRCWNKINCAGSTNLRKRKGHYTEPCPKWAGCSCCLAFPNNMKDMSIPAPPRSVRQTVQNTMKHTADGFCKSMNDACLSHVMYTVYDSIATKFGVVIN